MRGSRVYDLLLVVFVLALVWAGLARDVVAPVAQHASNAGAVGLVALLLIRPRRLGSPAATRRVVITAVAVAVAAGLVEMLVGTVEIPLGSSGAVVRFINTQDVGDAVAGFAAAALVVIVHVLLARQAAGAAAGGDAG